MFPSEPFPDGCAVHREIRAREALAHFLEKPSGSDCCDGFLHRADGDVQCALLLLLISHDRRRILHFNVTRYPTSDWVIQQLREAFPYQSGPKFLIFDHDRKYGFETPIALRSMGLTAVRTSFESPWQNGVAERWIESCRRDLLDHVIAANEAHLKRLLWDYIRYYHEDRAHLGLSKETPGKRVRSATRGRVIALSRQLYAEILPPPPSVSLFLPKERRHLPLVGVWDASPVRRSAVDRVPRSVKTGPKLFACYIF